jgi:outer membrane protein OmpA-like peptidoglycan-associated protein
VEFCELTLTVQGKQIQFPTGTGGDFDIDLSQSDEFKKLVEAEESGCASFVAGPSLFIKPGVYQGTVEYLGKPRSFSVTIPNSSEQIIDLGEIVIEIPPEPGQKTEMAPPAAPEPAVKAVAPLAAAAAPVVVKVPPVIPPPVAKPVAKPVERVVTKVAAKAAQKLAEAPPNGKTVAPKLLPDDLPIMEVNFRFGTAQLASYDDQAILTTAVRLLELFPYARLVVEGYADQMGSHEFNQALSKKRALTVAAELKKLGVPADKISKVSWFGKRTLLCNSMEARCREQNRRVVIQLVEGP